MAQKPTVSELLEHSPLLDASKAEDFLKRLPDRYFEGIDSSQIARDATRLFELERAGDHSIDIFEHPDEQVSIRVYAFDVPGLFSLLTGLLSSSGFSIEEGAIFTYTRESEETVTTLKRRHRPERIAHTREKPRYIIDSFFGTVSEVSLATWRNEFTGKAARVFELLSSSITAARQFVYEEVSNALLHSRVETAQALLPVEMDISEESDAGTSLTIVSEDTPFFLFAVSNALALFGFSIESVSIQTVGNRIEDVIEVTDSAGEAITDREKLNQVKMFVLLTKQFTYFLGSAPDPYAALVRFEQITKDLSNVEPLLSNPQMLRDLSKLLSASDFLWEDFIRTQYENILPLLAPSVREKPLSLDDGELENALDRLLANAGTSEEQKKALNDFKNREIYLIDLDHIVNPEADFLFLSRKLTRLAEVVVRSAVGIAGKILEPRYGKPLTFAGQKARYAVMGLGKLGGAAMGYASDIELLFIYADNGSTNGPESIGNAEYFERLFKTTTNLIDTKQEGIFRIDLRLRPHGNAGPIACSLESFCHYYGPGGQAHSYEKLALIRMRTIGGDAELGARIERIRDEMVYRSGSIQLRSLRELREKQLQQYSEGKHRGRPNAKFSPGALVDLEYSVQIIQCRYGAENPRLRTPRIHVALEELVRAGIMSGDEAEQLVSAYHFLRQLINGLRMLRGSARDLYMPPQRSDEYTHLARRTGYTGENGPGPAQKLRIDFETKTAKVRSFIEKYLGRDSVPGPPGGNAADLVFSDSTPADVASRILSEGGLQNHERALRNIELLKGDGEQKVLFARLAVLAWDLLRETPDPDMALNNWERYACSLPSKAEHYRQLLNQPLQLEVLLSLFAGSQFLADTVIREPELISWISRPKLIRSLRKTEDILDELTTISKETTDEESWMKALRLVKKRELLRIGTRDICLGAPFADVVTEISRLADAILQVTLSRAWAEVVSDGAAEDGASGGKQVERSGCAVFAFGKLGGEELNYSSDIDLLAVFDSGADAPVEAGANGSEAGNIDELFSKVMERLRYYLAEHTASGFVYRVDFRLRPYGRSGLLAHSFSSIVDYYKDSASNWERQALIKLRPVAGDLDFGRQVAERLSRFPAAVDPGSIAAEIKMQRSLAASRRSAITTGVDVKSGKGGIRDIEFLVQGLQLIHAEKIPDILSRNTLSGLQKLIESNIIDPATGAYLRRDYLFLRRVEHFLQLLDDRQVHVVPTDRVALDALARRIDGKDEDGGTLKHTIEETMARVHRAFEELLQ